MSRTYQLMTALLAKSDMRSHKHIPRAWWDWHISVSLSLTWHISSTTHTHTHTLLSLPVAVYLWCSQITHVSAHAEFNTREKSCAHRYVSFLIVQLWFWFYSRHLGICTQCTVSSYLARLLVSYNMSHRWALSETGGNQIYETPTSRDPCYV